MEKWNRLTVIRGGGEKDNKERRERVVKGHV